MDQKFDRQDLGAFLLLIAAFIMFTFLLSEKGVSSISLWKYLPCSIIGHLGCIMLFYLPKNKEEK